MKFCLPVGIPLRQFAMFFCTLAMLSVVSLAAKEFVKPVANAAKTYPAHDEHPKEKVTVAIDPYDMADKAQIFSVNYREQDIVPIFLIVTNDGDQPVTLNDVKAQLVTLNRTKLSPASTDDLYRRLSHPARSDTPYPLPFPRKKVKGAVSKKALDEINSAQFGAKAVEPHTTQSGFLFFDVSGISTPLAGANFYLSGMHDASGGELMYFEIPLEKYLIAPASKPTVQ
ncbi:MAG: hypothetical protein DMG71_01965 [Acidobacteria bacterium]|nr:MAG: hypothetical protein DMG71_01965 [Acidobacteriota bacterium]